MTSAAYVRVSSRTQDFTTQKAAIERLAHSRGDKRLTWFSEKVSGKSIKRPVLEELRAAVRRGEVRRLYLFRLDRLTRSGIRDTFELVEEFKAAGVEIRSVSDGFSLDGPAAEVVLAVMAWAAKMERLAINERISAARDRIERQGGKWGRPSRVDAALRARVVALRRQGRTIREIAVALKVPRATVGRVSKT